MFEKMRSDPQVELVGQETWDNGHTMHVLRSQQEIKLLVNNEITHPMGLVTFYFDVHTYQLLGSRVTMQKDGKEVLISSQRVVLDEILPAKSTIAWDLSDLRGINIVDDPNGEHSLPGKIPRLQALQKNSPRRRIWLICSRLFQIVFHWKSVSCRSSLQMNSSSMKHATQIKQVIISPFGPWANPSKIVGQMRPILQPMGWCCISSHSAAMTLKAKSLHRC